MAKYIKKLVYLDKPCKQCGALMRGTAKQLEGRVFCSRQCNADDRKAHNRWTCLGCGEIFHRRPTGQNAPDSIKYCSRACSVPALVEVRRPANEIRKTATRQAKARKRGVASLIRALIRLTRKKEKERACLVCGADVEPRKRLCSPCKDEKQKAMVRKYRSRDKAMRRARLRGGDAIDPLVVFARDRWRCMLCGGKTPRQLRGSYEDNAPELDHVIPLAQGGTHTWANVQCACRACNIRKGSRPLGQIGLAFGA